MVKDSIKRVTSRSLSYGSSFFVGLVDVDEVDGEFVSVQYESKYTGPLYEESSKLVTDVLHGSIPYALNEFGIENDIIKSKDMTDVFNTRDLCNLIKMDFIDDI